MEAFIEQKDEDEHFMQAIFSTAAPDASSDVNDIRFSEWLEIWQKDYLSDVKPSTKATYRSAIDNHINPGLGSYPLSKLKAPVLQSFFNQLSNEKSSAQNISRTFMALFTVPLIRLSRWNIPRKTILPSVPFRKSLILKFNL